MGVKSGKRTKADLEREIADLRARVAQQDKVIAKLLTRPSVQYVPMPMPAPVYPLGGPTWQIQIPSITWPSPTLPGVAPNTYPQIICGDYTTALSATGAATLPNGYGVSVQ